MRYGLVLVLAAWCGVLNGAVLKKQLGKSQGTLINGSVVTSGHDNVVMLSIDGAVCTGTLVGPRIVVTAAHCVADGQKASFEYKDTQYVGKGLRSSKYPSQDHDIAVVVLKKGIVGGEYAHIGGKAVRGTKLKLFGYGCTDIGGKKGIDGKLRTGENVVIGFGGYDMISRSRNGGALCFGDSGGPSFVKVGKDWKLLGVNSKGNIRDTNYNTRLDIGLSRKFLNSVRKKFGAEICGIGSDCKVKKRSKPKPETEPCKAIFFSAEKKMKEYRKSCLK